MLLQELKGFLMRGSVVELAVGVIIGSAFGKIVTALVDKIFMPVLGIALGGVNFEKLTFYLWGVSVEYGSFIQAVFDFTLIGVALFFLLRLLGRHPGMSAQAPPSPTETLLTEIRDLIKEKKHP